MSETNQEMLDQISDEAQGSALEGFVTVGTFPEPATANLARTALESAGIPSFLQGENANNLIPMAFTARLQVSAADESAARDVLASAEFAPESLEGVTAAEVAGEDPTR